MGAAVARPTTVVAPQTPALPAEYVAALVDALPLAEPLPGGDVLKLCGRNGWFNPAPLLSDRWTHGRFTSQEWSQLIAYLNATVAATPNVVSSSWQAQDHYGSKRGVQPCKEQVDEMKRALAAVAPQWAARGVILTLNVSAEYHQLVNQTYPYFYMSSPCILYASMPGVSA